MPATASSQDHLGRLCGRTNKELVALWSNLGLRGDPPHFKRALVRGIAWHLQGRERGGLDAETRRLLKRATWNAPDASTKRTNTTKRTHQRLKLRTGTTLVRTWRGTAHEVTVLENGKRYQYRDAEYDSLSVIAREITGARWSGPRFFGLTKLGGAA